MEQPPHREVIDEDLREEILSMVEDDQRMRADGIIDAQVDINNTARIKEIIADRGWPGISRVGEDAAHGVWLLVQHADRDVEFQKTALELMLEAVEKKEAQKDLLAYLIDRVRINSGKPQLYGTQSRKDENGQLAVVEIEDEKHLEERRREFGLGSNA